MARYVAHCAYLVIFAAAMSIRVGSAPLMPSACNTDGELSSTTLNVKYDGSPSFSDKGIAFPAHVYSLYELPPWQTNVLCFRYEFENAGNILIPLSYWKLMDEYSAYDIPAHDRIKRSKRRLSLSKTAVEGPTVIEAFRSEQVPTFAWMTIEDWHASVAKKAEASEPTPYLHFERSATLDPAANKAIQDHQIPDADIAVIEPAGYYASKPPPVSDELNAPFGLVRTSSVVFSTGSQYAVYSSIVFEPKTDAKISEMTAPALVAMEANPNDTESYLRALADQSSRRSIQRLIEKHDYTVYLYFKFGNPLFLVDYPITIRWSDPRGKHVACTKVASYSAFPVSLDQSYCLK